MPWRKYHFPKPFISVISQLIFKNLYKNCGREKGTLRYFREKLQRRNVTVDVKHFEDCEQLFVSTGKCFVVEALIQFFNMESKDGQPTQNKPPYHILEFGDKTLLQYSPGQVSWWISHCTDTLGYCAKSKWAKHFCWSWFCPKLFIVFVKVFFHLNCFQRCSQRGQWRKAGYTS